MSTAENLSARRGNQAGIAFFKGFIRIFGVGHACNFAWFVALFYALFDRRAGALARAYLRVRFPEHGRMRLWFDTYRLLTSQAQALIISGGIAQKGWDCFPYSEENRSEILSVLKDPQQGCMILMSHFGCWQAAMAGIAGFHRKVNLLARPDAQRKIKKQVALRDDDDDLFHEIPTDGFMGGLLEAMQAIARGEIVCIMGDRVDGGDAMEADFFAHSMRLPLSPWILAARCHCPVIPFFVPFEKHCGSLLLSFAPVIRVEADPDRRIGKNELQKPVQRYAKALQGMAERYPYQFFRFEDDTQ